MNKNNLTVYLSGEIHTQWREEIIELAHSASLNITWLLPITHHAKSDDCGELLLGKESTAFWKDHKAAKINAIRTRTFLKRADIVIVKFGEKYKQWNAAFDAGMSIALNKPLIVIHPQEHTHALKEVDAQALAVAETQEQAVNILTYVLSENE